MWYKKVKIFYIVVNCFIWIIIKNYEGDIKSKKSINILILVSIKKYKKGKKRKKKYMNSYALLYTVM